MNKAKIERLVAVLGVILFGTASSLISQLFDLKRSSFPLFQTLIMFIGELLCFFFIFINKKERAPYNCSPLMTKFGDYCFFLSGIFDFLNSLLEAICAFYITNFAFFWTLKMLATLYVLLYRKLYVNKSIYKHQKIGILIYIIGMIIIVFQILYDIDKTELDINSFYCILGMLFAELCQACNLISQEKFLKRLDSTSGAANGMKGVIGLILTGTFYIPLHYFMDDVMDTEKSLDPIDRLDDPIFSLLCTS